MPSKKSLAATILAGGRSSRMGTEKGLMPFRGKPLIRHIIDLIQSLGINPIQIITQHGAYEQFDLPCYPDLIQNKGPLGGIYSGLVHSTSSKNLVLGCDMPFITKELIKALIAEMGNEDVLLCQHNNKQEPLCAIYDSRCAPHIKEKLEKNELKITDALTGLNIRSVSFDGQPWFTGHEFSNLNTLDELIKHQQ